MFTELDRDRRPSLDRKREHANLTIPALMPFEGQNQHQDVPVPYNSMVAEGVNNLASRLVSVVLPLNNLPVFELFVDQQFNPEGRDTRQVEEVLTRVERATMSRAYLTNLRPQLFLAFKHLIVTGDVLLMMLPDLDIRLHRIDEYVVKRTTEGVWREIIIREMIDPSLNPELDAINPVSRREQASQLTGFPRTANVAKRTFEPLYTRFSREGEFEPVRMTREFRGAPVQLEGGNTFEVSPVMPIRWGALSGEDYGMSLVEEQFGDVRSLDGMSAGLLDGVAMAGEFRWGVNPSGITEIGDVRESVNGDWIAAAEQDIFPLSFANANQISAVLGVVTHRENRLGRRFLMNSAVQPSGERVTARQVTILAEELEQSLGGALSMLNREIMIPYVRRAIFQLADEQDGTFPSEFGDIIKDPKGILKLRIRAGLELLQREADRERMLEITREFAGLPPEAQRVIKWANWGRTLIIASGIEPEGLVKTEQEIAAEDEALLMQQKAALAEQAATQVAVDAAGQAPQPQAEGA
jgi:hypothetical protein